jgi:5-carboxymethyl-2-hydroxymuconate isomerase
MRLLSFTARGRESFGVVSGNGVIDLGARAVASARTMAELLAAGALDQARRVSAGASADLGLDEIEFLPPIPKPSKVLCVGVNYAERHEEYGDRTPPPAYPSIFMRTPGSFVGHGAALMRPQESREFDYEGEIALIIGRRARRVAEPSAAGIIAGVTCANDGTLRDWVRHGKFNVTPGKNFEQSGAIGPWLATLDDVGPLDALTVATTVNGEQRQHDTTAHLLFSIPRLLAYVSTFTALEPGDVILTGTPPGAGARRQPPIYLEAGDRVDVTVDGVGTLSNVVEDEPAG